jgi:hypothetical protein
MDERKKTIAILEDQKNRVLQNADSVLTGLGRGILEHAATAFAANPRYDLHGDSAEHERIRQTIAQTEEKIAILERNIESLTALHAEAYEKEKNIRQRREEVAALHVRLGKIVLEDSALAGSVQQKPAYDVLVERITAKEQRLLAIENQKRGNLFVKIGQGLQSITAKALL